MTDHAVNKWPDGELEVVSCCPACGSSDRRMEYANLTDALLGVAPGVWDLQRCARCASVYLDPRPTPASIGLAYSSYLTHSPVDAPIVSRSGVLKRFVHDALNGYLNHRYGLDRKPASTLGRWVIPWLPFLKAAADAECRNLPRRTPDGRRLLDVGSGSGRFLEVANRMGWEVSGVDFDAKAVQAARSRGLQVREGGVDTLAEEAGSFDVITLGHVIEHVHEPGVLLQTIFGLLKPGGMLWIETPNIASLGALHFGRSWYGLDPPRHLMVFNSTALGTLLRQAGFITVRQRWRGMIVSSVYAESAAIAGRLGIAGTLSGRRLRWAALMAELREMLLPGRREFLTFTARKPL